VIRWSRAMVPCPLASRGGPG